jgi:PUA domain protein
MLEGDWEDRLVMVDGEPLVLVWEDTYFPTVHGALKMESRRRRVVVDMGAVPYVINGAHIMGPGIVEVDDEIKVDDLVIITEERHGKALAIGKALIPGDRMPRGEGRAVLNIHHVGDRLWELQY